VKINSQSITYEHVCCSPPTRPQSKCCGRIQPNQTINEIPNYGGLQLRDIQFLAYSNNSTRVHYLSTQHFGHRNRDCIDI